MKNRLRKYFAGSVVILSLMTACSLPKNIEEQKVNQLPEKFDGQAVEKTETFIPITLTTYFNDPDLLALFDKITKSNPDFQILQQRILIANSHLKRSKL